MYFDSSEYEVPQSSLIDDCPSHGEYRNDHASLEMVEYLAGWLHYYEVDEDRSRDCGEKNEEHSEPGEFRRRSG